MTTFLLCGLHQLPDYGCWYMHHSIHAWVECHACENGMCHISVLKIDCAITMWGPPSRSLFADTCTHRSISFPGYFCVYNSGMLRELPPQELPVTGDQLCRIFITYFLIATIHTYSWRAVCFHLSAWGVLVKGVENIPLQMDHKLQCFRCVLSLRDWQILY